MILHPFNKPWHVLRPPMPWHQAQVCAAEGELVVLLHGLWRSLWAMDPIARHLHNEGFHTVNLPYPSFRQGLDQITENIYQELILHSKGGPIHFVTHSLGGIVLRKLLHELPREQTGRIVMLAPPNQGCEIIDWLDGYKPLKSLLGPAGHALHRGKVDVPIIDITTDTAVIMGQRCAIPFFKRLLEPNNDGIVSVDSGKMEGINEFHVVDSDHTFITTEPEVMKIATQFIQRGQSSFPASTQSSHDPHRAFDQPTHRGKS